MSILSQAKYYYDRFHVDNEWDDSAAITWMGKRYTPEKLLFFKRFFACLMSDKFMNKGTEIYMKDAQNSIKRAARIWNEHNPNDKISENNAVGHFNYCSKKLKYIFDDEDMLNKVMSSPKGIESKYLRQLNNFIEKYGIKQVTDKEMIIRLPHYTKLTDVSEEDFIAFLRLIEPYSKKYIKNVQNQVNKNRDVVGYLNYIMIPDIELTDDEMYRKGMVEAMLGNNEMTLDNYLSKLNEVPCDFSETDMVEEDSEVDNEAVYSELDKKITDSFNEQAKQLSEEVKTIKPVEIPKEILDFDLDDIDDDIIDLGDFDDLDMRTQNDYDELDQSEDNMSQNVNDTVTEAEEPVTEAEETVTEAEESVTEAEETVTDEEDNSLKTYYMQF